MRAVLNHRQATLGALLLVFFVLMAAVGPWFVQDPSRLVGVPLSPPSTQHWFGTTGQGQDVLAQTVAGARITLLVGFVVGLSVVVIGALVGTAAGYYGGWIDECLGLLINIFLIMPGLPLIVVIAAYLPAGPVTIGAVLIFTGWAWGARVIRSQTLSLRDRDFIAAAIAGGESDLRILWVEILPNMSSLLLSSFIGATVYAIGAQVGLEYLGLGDVSQVTWGTNLYWAANDAALLTRSWWTFVPTGLGIAGVGFALAALNSAVDEIGNPRLKPHRAFERALAEAGLPRGPSTPVLRRNPEKGHAK